VADIADVIRGNTCKLLRCTALRFRVNITDVTGFMDYFMEYAAEFDCVT